jgi:hypothetical protein
MAGDGGVHSARELKLCVPEDMPVEKIDDAFGEVD